jgi:uncharacterized protein YfaS (alpha-2-macroglobulin family)
MNFKTIISLNFFILLFTFNSNAQFWKCKKRKNVKTELIESANPIISKNYKDVRNKYDKLFTEIDSFIDLYQTIEVNKKIEEVLALAHLENEHGYFYKGILYQFGNKDWGEDDIKIVQWNYLDSITKISKIPIQPFFSLLKAQFLAEIFENKNFYFGNELISDDQSPNPNNWSKELLNKEINQYINQALLLGKGLQMENNLNPIFENKSDYDIEYALEYDIETTVEQTLVLKSIDILSKIALTSTLKYLSPDLKTMVLPVSDFTKHDFTSNDDPKNEYRILQLYQVLLKNYHIYWDLKRLEFVNTRFNKNKEYLEALNLLYIKELEHAESNLIAVVIANHLIETNKKQAHELLTSALKKHPNYSQNTYIELIIKKIESISLDASVEKIITPNQNFLGKIEYKNLNSIFVSVLKMDYKKFYLGINDFDEMYTEIDDSLFKSLIKEMPKIQSYQIALPNFMDFNLHSTEIRLNAIDKGTYMLIFTKNENYLDSAILGYSKIFVNDFLVIEKKDKSHVVDAQNGNYLENVGYTIFEINYNNGKYLSKITNSNTLKDGIIDIPENKNKSFLIELNDGTYYIEKYSSSLYKFQKEKESTQFKLLTDRNLYRPGQTVYFKAIAYKNLAKKVIPNETYTIVLKDNNYQEKGRMQLKTNAFGSISGQFELPKSGSGSGNFHIEIINHTSRWFKVEEYKLPKYSAEILQPQQAYKINDPIELTGKAEAFAGYAIQNANVSYTVTRKEKIFYWNYWSRYMPSQPYESLVLANENTKTDDKGTFKIKFKALPDDTKDNKTFYNFEVNATITDQNGEVKTCQYTLTLSEIDRTISINANPNYILNESIEIDYHLKNLLDKSLPFTGKIECFKIQSNNKLQRKRLWVNPDTTLISEFEFQKDFSHYEALKYLPKLQLIHTQNFDNNIQNKWAVPKQLLNSSGEYIFRISGKDGKGNPIVNETIVTILPDKAGSFQLNQALYIYSVNGLTFEPKQTAKILIGGSVNSMVQLKISSNRGVILEKNIFIKNQLELIEIPIIESDRGGIAISAFTINDYRNYKQELFINVPFSNKKIDVQLSSFRSDIEPGSKEKWKLKIKGPASEVSKIESAAVMYNQSMEQIYGQNQWNFNLYFQFRNYNQIKAEFLVSYFVKKNEFENFNFVIYLRHKTINSIEIDYSQFKKAGFRNDGLITTSTTKSEAFEEGETKKEEVFQGFVNKSLKLKVNKTSSVSNSQSQINTPPPIRKNFNETAFFYPHLYADAQGNLELEFNVPEALTQWRMMLLAHSTSMQIGYLEQSITTSKKVMVQPNIPRFLRQNETIVLSSKIVNTTSSPIQVDAKIEVKNPENGKLFDWCNNAVQKINVAANGVAQVSFKVNIPDYIGLASISIVAANQQVSDGEEHTLLVVSNRQLITESMPITIRKAGVQNLEFSSLKNNTSSSLKHEKLIVEMSENPAWYAIQALPYMMEYPHECAEQTFTRLYANSIAMYLANSSPEIKKIYDLWVQESKKNNGFQSKLSQNQDLKSVLLEETPWLREANNETQRMQQLGQLFDSKTMNNELEKSFDKLKDMQMNNGAWGWFKGMYPNEYITQTIVIGFGKMNKIGIDITKYQNMINKAMDYLDQEAKKDFEQYKMNPTESFLPSNLQYLYCKSYFTEIGFNNQSEVVNYYINNAEKTWQKSGLMNQAQLLVALKVLKPSSNVPKLIYTAFEQNAKSNPEMGMYWSRNVKAWYWHEAPIETHAAIMEAYKTMDNKMAIKELQIWLLRQKQTQSWSTTRSTADACYALLSNNTFINNQQSVVVSINNKDIKPQQKQAGTGYYRENIEKNDIQNNSGNIKVTAKTDDFAYGAVYWQYFEDLDKVKSAASGLSITKKIFKLVNTDKGKERKEVMDTSLLKVGDFIEVVLVVSSDRNLEYVHIKDGRAAGTEPRDVLSQYQWQNGIGYFQSTKDVSTNFFIDQMNKGVYQLSYILKVEQAGVFNSGLATVQCMYAPEFIANSKAQVLKVE